MPVRLDNQSKRVHICVVLSIQDGSWTVYIQDRQLTSTSVALQAFEFPAVLTPVTLLKYLSILEDVETCIGNPDKELMKLAAMRKGIFKDTTGKMQKAYVDTIAFVSEGHVYSTTIRSTECEILVVKGRCKVCKVYRRTLLTMASRAAKHDVNHPGSHTNWRYLSTPQKTKRATKRTRLVSIVLVDMCEF